MNVSFVEQFKGNIMPLYNVPHDEIQRIVSELDQALYNHQQWHKELLRILICKLACDKHDLNSDAHKECRFGQWYYDQAHNALRDHPGFIAIGEQHQRVHQTAIGLLNASNIGIRPAEYDSFANTLERMRLEIDALKRELEELLYKRDPLTGAISRIDMLPILREQQELAKRQKIPCCLVMMDLDLFKNVNDHYGHSIGDRVLAASARFVIESVRPYDKVFRYGGEEFLIFVQQIELKSAYENIEKIRQGLAQMPIQIEQEEPIHITASFGLTELDTHSPIEQSIDHADKAMYAAKSAGRNCIKIWDKKK